MTKEEAAQIIQHTKMRMFHDTKFSRNLPFTREQINQAYGMAIGYLFRDKEGTINRFDEMVRITDIIEEKTGHRYELVYDHDEPDIAVLILRGENEADSV